MNLTLKMSYYRSLYFLGVIAVALLHHSECTEVKLESKLGSVIGISEQVEFMGENKFVTRFLGIPYAKSPTADRRFGRPEPFGNFSQAYNATFFRPHCMQSESVNPYIKYFETSEDCLHLNVFTPGSTVSSERKYSVMIFIHGGSFTYSGADIFSGDRLSAFNDVVIVTLNYRLNTFGFLSNGTTSSGNMGLWDQKMAIQWVHDNIADFGGDPENVTLFGQSAGAVSVLYQALNPTNRGLFSRILTQSGSVLAQWAQQYSPSEIFSEFVTTMNCNQEHYNDILQCLQSKPADALVTNNFRPVVDGDFIKEDPFLTFASDRVDSASPLSLLSEVDFLLGVASKDGAGVVTRMENSLKAIGVDIAEGVPRNIFESQFIPSMVLQLYGTDTPEALVRSIILQYTDWSKPNDPEANRDKMVDFASDVAFISPAVKVAKKHQTIRNSDRQTYFYVFDYKPPIDPTPLWLDGAKHTMDIPYVFGLPDDMKVVIGIPPNVPLILPPSELKLSSIVMKMWTNFAKSGDPNSPVQIDADDAPTWPSYNTDTQSYLEISPSMTSQSIKSYFAEPRMEFWANIVPFLESCNTCRKQNCTENPGDRHTSTAHSVQFNVPLLFLPFVLLLKT